MRQGEAFGEKYLVILSTSAERGRQVPGLLKLKAAPELGARVTRLDSSAFKNLQPCFEIVVAQAFTELETARAWATSLEKLGVEFYIKNAGRYVGQSAAMERHCEARRLDRNTSCGGVRFAESWGGRVFMALDETIASPSNQSPLGGDRRVWYAALPDRVRGAHRVGDHYELWGDPESRCRIIGFAVLTRGEPHFSYFRDEDGAPFELPPKDDGPGCGSPEVFAELRCPHSFEEVALVVPAEDGRFERYEEEAEASGEQREHVLAATVLDRTVRAAIQEARRLADERQAPLQEESSFRVFAKGDRRFIFARHRAFTGEGNASCGSEDVLIEVSGVFTLRRDQSLAVAVPFSRTEDHDLEAVVDLEGDGVPELLERSPYGRHVVRGKDTSPRCELVVPYCDCPC